MPNVYWMIGFIIAGWLLYAVAYDTGYLNCHTETMLQEKLSND